jgi:hypothetical protein
MDDTGDTTAPQGPSARENFARDATQLTLNWMYFRHLDSPVLEEAMAIIRSGILHEQAATELGAWFTDRLTIDPGVSGPFGSLGADLISMALVADGGIGWGAIVGTIRRRED